MGKVIINGQDCGHTDKDREEFLQDLYEVMEESFSEFVWDDKLVKSTKYKPEEDEDGRD